MVLDGDKTISLNMDSNSFKIIVKGHSNINLEISKLSKEKNLEIELENDSSLTIYSLIEEETKMISLNAKVMKNASICGNILDFSLNNNNFVAVIDLLEEGARGNISVASLSKDEDRKLFDISINHIANNTHGLNECFGVCKNNSHLTFTGVSDVRKDAVNSETRQVAKIVVFDESCRAKTSPILKISENEINASHAASVGTLSDEQIFYLMSRGIKENDARNIITLGYLKPIINRFDESVIKHVEDLLKERM